MKLFILPQILLLICLAVTFNPIKSYGQEFEKRTVFVKKIDEKIQLDGVLSEPIWEVAEKADDFWQIFPTDSLRSTNETVVRLLYDDSYIYVSAIAKGIGPDFRVSSLSGL